MKKLSAAKLRWQNSFSQFRRTTGDWSYSCISPLTGVAPTHAYINFFSFWLNNLYNEIKSERAIYQVSLMLKSTVLANETLFY